MLFADTLTLDAPRRTADGYLAVRAKAARTGVYEYGASEPSIVDALPEGHSFKPTDIIRVLRDENTVFDQRSAHSFIGKPITDDHPAEAVNAGNWRDHARGVVMGALRDGDHLSFDLLLTDAATIKKVDDGKVELSNGYGARLEFGDFTAPDGTKCHARQQSISGNHVAIVDRGRAGSTCKIGDAKPCDAAPQTIFDSLINREPEMTTKTITFDGLPLLVTDAAEAAIGKLLGQITVLTTAKDAAEGQVATHVTTIAAKDAEIVTLKKAVEDGKVTPAQLREAGKAYDKLVADAKRIAPNVQVTDAMDDAAIRKAVVTAKLGDANVAGWTDAQFETSFVTNVALLGDTKTVHTAPNGQPVNLGDAASAYDTARAKQKAALRDGWKTPFNAADAA